MRFLLAVLGFSFVAAAISSMAAEPSGDRESQTTKATYLITGLHCPPCTRTVESSLARIQGVRSAKVDWRTKVAQIEFDENLVPAQTLAQRIASTPHMMRGDMKYDGWLALKVPDVKDDAVAKKVKQTLGGIKGVKQVVVFPKQQTIGVQFESAGGLTSGQLIGKLNDAGLKAGTALPAEPPPASKSTNRIRPAARIAQATPADPHAGMEMDHSKMEMPNQTAASMDHGAMNHAGMDHGAMGHMMCGCSMCMQMMGMARMNGMSMGMANGVPAGMSRGAPATGRGYGGVYNGRGCGCL
jgi:copper chaperone CopZ